MNHFVKEIGRAFSIGVLIFLVTGIIRYSNGVRYDSFPQLAIEFGKNQLYSIVLYMANAYLMRSPQEDGGRIKFCLWGAPENFHLDGGTKANGGSQEIS